ncbi:hypothetical protein PXH69_21310 [Rhodococcus qingshengii]|uniref:Replication protein n=1 Tax=Rhodococcus qingshengii TaxID=334542 RepID=A0AAW6LQE5_RHOSG|nr:hypothetical protein [Rhodococcus qingshengii]MDE8647515.1 hypothetical protein [Rhodococcus qingshengii]
MSEIADFAPEWHSALDAADTALTALRDATAHRGAVPVIADRPAPNAPIHSIRSWILNVRKVIARTIPLVINAAGHHDEPHKLAADLTDAAESITTLHAMNQQGGQRGTTSWALPSAASGVVPVWTNRRSWLAQAQHAVNLPEGRESCKRHRTCPEAVLKHAAVYATHADGLTGRGVTVSRATIMKATGMSEAVDKRVRRVLRDLSLLFNAATGRTLTTAEYLAAILHHGFAQSRAASTIHLTTPPHLAHITAAPPKRHRTKSAAQNRDPLSLKSLSRRESSFKKNSPNARERARGQGKSQKTRKESRPLHLQRAAAELLNRVPALRRASHIGSICQVIASTGIDTTTWTGRDIAKALDEDSQRRGWMWPSSIDNPCALMAWRLRRINWNGVSPSAAAAKASETLREARIASDQARHLAEAQRASEATRRQRMAEIAALLAPKTPTNAPARSTVVAGSDIKEARTTPPNLADAREAARAAARAEVAALRKRTNPTSFIITSTEGIPA